MDYHYDLDHNDPRSINFYNQGLGRGMLVTCKVCQHQDARSRMHNIESITEELWFCSLEHVYVHKVSRDILYNPNYNLWTRIRHYTESTRNAGHQYEMNQTRIFRLAKIYLQESDQDLTEALEPLATDRINQPWSYEEMSLILRAEQGTLTDEEEQELQDTLAASFDISHPDFCKELALANLRHSFEVPVDLCKECLYVKHQDELDQNDGCCTDCVSTPPPIYSPEPEPEITHEPEPELSPILEPDLPPSDPELSTDTPTPTPDATLTIILQLQQQVAHQSQLIERLETKVKTLESFNQQLIQVWKHDSLYAQERATQFSAFLDSQNF